MLGVVLALAAALCYGTGSIFVRLGLRSLSVPIGTLISISAGVLLVGSLALSLNFDEISQLSPKVFLWFALIGVVNYVLGRRFNYSAIKYIGVTRASPLFASSPLFAMVFAIVLVGERINLVIGAGTFILVAGLYLVVTSE